MSVIPEAASIAGLVDGSLTATLQADGTMSLCVTTSAIEGRTRYIELVLTTEQIAELYQMLSRDGILAAPCSVGISF